MRISDFNIRANVKVIEMERRVLGAAGGICIFQAERLVHLTLEAG